MPGAIDLVPIAGRLPAFIGHRGKAVHQPERRGGIAAVLHESEPFGVGDEVAVEPDRPDECAMRRLLVVEMKTVVGVADRMYAFVQRDPFLSPAARGGKAPARV